MRCNKNQFIRCIALACMFSAPAAKAGEEIIDCDVCPVIVSIPAGEFTMGSSGDESGHLDEKPSHSVTIARAFGVGKFEVTFDQWDACVTAGGCKTVDDEGWGRGTRPVINIDYAAARGYTEWLSKKTGKSYRLLSEAEWEYTARAETSTAWFWGDHRGRGGIPAACLYANSHDQTSMKNRPDFTWIAHPCEDQFTYTAPVGSFKPNPFGLHDILGNVREWVADCKGRYAEAPTDGSAFESGQCEHRIARGGGWIDGPTWLRSSYRHPQPANYANYAVGFRVARDLR